MPRLRSKLATLALSLAALLAFAAPGLAQVGDFRIDSRVYVQRDGELEQVSHNVTFFQGDTIYDFNVRDDGSQGEVAVLNLTTATFLLLDPDREVVTSFTPSMLEELIDTLDARARQSESMLIRFMADPRFGETYNAEDRRLTLAAQEASYSVQGELPEDTSLPARYAEFADWFAKAKYTRPGAPPATARLALNRALVEHGIIPRQVQLEFREDTGNRVRLQSTHDYIWQLSAKDQEWIEWARGQAGSLPIVMPHEYHGLQ